MGEHIEEPKPHIDDVCMAFHLFHQAVARIMAGPMGEQYVRMDEARVMMRDRLEKLGLADAIDWSGPNVS